LFEANEGLVRCTHYGVIGVLHGPSACALCCRKFGYIGWHGGMLQDFKDAFPSWESELYAITEAINIRRLPVNLLCHRVLSGRRRSLVTTMTFILHLILSLVSSANFYIGRPVEALISSCHLVLGLPCIRLTSSLPAWELSIGYRRLSLYVVSTSICATYLYFQMWTSFQFAPILISLFFSPSTEYSQHSSPVPVF